MYFKYLGLTKKLLSFFLCFFLISQIIYIRRYSTTKVSIKLFYGDFFPFSDVFCHLFFSSAFFSMQICLFLILCAIAMAVHSVFTFCNPLKCTFLKSMLCFVYPKHVSTSCELFFMSCFPPLILVSPGSLPYASPDFHSLELFYYALLPF